MKTRVLNFFICILLPALSISSCLKEPFTNPQAKIEVFKMDENDSLIIPDSIFVEDEIVFQSSGAGEHFVIWPGEKRVEFSGVFTFTSSSFEKMEQQLVPDSIINALKFLENNEYKGESKLSHLIRAALGGDLDLFYTYEYQIKSSGVGPTKDSQGNDSTKFKYNHDYLDYLSANEKGLYNISGWPLTVNKDGTSATKTYQYKLPGKYKAILVAISMSEYGAITHRDTTSIELFVYPNL